MVGPWALVQVFVLVLFPSLWQRTSKIWCLDSWRAQIEAQQQLWLQLTLAQAGLRVGGAEGGVHGP